MPGASSAHPEQNAQLPLIAVVEDDATIAGMISTLLAEEGFRSIVWPTSEGAAALIRRERPALVILDIWLEQPDSGWRLLDELRRDASTMLIPIVVCSAHAFMLSTMAAWHQRGRYAFLDKPFEVDDLMQAINSLLDRVHPT